MRVEVTKIYGFGTWRWRLRDQDFCIICQSSFEHSCTVCDLPGEGCPPILGHCRHGYHLHCIEKWLAEKKKDECPTCKQRWEFDFSDISMNSLYGRSLDC
ncbi:hypothetical protein DSO57_1037236 [Entomophthora muscae]|uniref:Uncharacterized protein n=1 Tax=Entomophthora muscae TaxID=34485 RepID=A0ACC2TLE8_9FUNG|nr:hypothetical protein DSO57_1037236 [Entomophthora muscae]